MDTVLLIQKERGEGGRERNSRVIKKNGRERRRKGEREGVRERDLVL